MAGAGMDRRRVYDFLDEETATRCAAEATVVTGGIVVELEDTSKTVKRSGPYSQTKILTAAERAQSMQAAVVKVRNASNTVSAERKAEAGKTEDGKVLEQGMVKTVVTLRPLWDEESVLAGKADDRGRPQFECITLRQNGSDQDRVSLHSEGPHPIAAQRPGGERSETQEGSVPLKTESAPADKVFGPEQHNDLVNFATDLTVRKETCVVLLHGQTGSGKTCTALRLHQALASSLFESCANGSSDQISVSYWELSAQNRANDLLSSKEVKILESEGFTDDECLGTDKGQKKGASGSIKISGLTSTFVQSLPDLLKTLQVAEERRSSRETVVHEASSRSHAFCRFMITSGEGEMKQTITVVDLAGAENSLETFANRGAAMEETKFISTSLASLQECVRCLRLNQTHVPYRRSKLTMLLKDVLSASGSAQSTQILWVTHLSPMSWDASHSRRSLQFMKELQGLSAPADKGPRPPEKWTKADVRKWVLALESGKYAHMANALAWANGASLKQEWKYDLAKRLAASGDCTEEEGCDIYEAFHAEIVKFKKVRRKQSN